MKDREGERLPAFEQTVINLTFPPTYSSSCADLSSWVPIYIQFFPSFLLDHSNWRHSEHVSWTVSYLRSHPHEHVPKIYAAIRLMLQDIKKSSRYLESLLPCAADSKMDAIIFNCSNKFGCIKTCSPFPSTEPLKKMCCQLKCVVLLWNCKIYPHWFGSLVYALWLNPGARVWHREAQ